jgi:hypothetical protein
VALNEGGGGEWGRYDWAEAFGNGDYEKLGGEDCWAVGYFLFLEFGLEFG